MYQTNDIVTFQTADENLNGIIKGLQGEHYHIKGNNAKTYFKTDSEIIECIGKVYINEARAKAEEWQREKGDYRKKDEI